jgi:2-keto-4-pentenoate hydratase/2-oxohepta-3-ene-1,7-dioic acid hydratase in catechol pathway
MRFVRFDSGATGLLVDSGVVDVEHGISALAADSAALLRGLLPDRRGSWQPMIRRWLQARPVFEQLEQLAERGVVETVGVGEVRLEPPLPDTAGRIFAMGGNFPAHVADSEIEMPESVRFGNKADTPPWGFYVIPGTVVGPDAEIRPPAQAQKLDYEAEVGVVLGAGAGSVWGFTAWNDFSIRDAAFGLSKTDHGPLTWSLCKNFPSANACGPYMLVDADVDVQALRISCRVNGALRQDGSTSQMTWSFAEVAEYISTFLPLGAGDMILSGTPSGTAMEGGVDGRFLQAGDVTEVEVERIGVLRNRVVPNQE